MNGIGVLTDYKDDGHISSYDVAAVVEERRVVLSVSRTERRPGMNAAEGRELELAGDALDSFPPLSDTPQSISRICLTPRRLAGQVWAPRM